MICAHYISIYTKKRLLISIKTIDNFTFYGVVSIHNYIISKIFSPELHSHNVLIFLTNQVDILVGETMLSNVTWECPASFFKSLHGNQ